ncbi:hypothetical protein EZS27_039226 [termite gut metagenome]|uniref:Transposase InsH N-terminal domain-containing protein n=1 Tax=termite gut metagenome TaxID=433724 RepID=A0A5J4PIX4_9ZZZZ
MNRKIDMKLGKYKTSGNCSFFDEQEIKEKLREIGNPLEKIIEVIDFEMFLSLLETQMLNHNKKNNAGANPFDVVMMFKIMILQRYYGLGDSQIEYQIIDRISFKSFLGLSNGDKVPDEKTVWAFRESITNKGVIEKLFAAFTDFLESKGFLMNEPPFGCGWTQTSPIGNSCSNSLCPPIEHSFDERA